MASEIQLGDVVRDRLSGFQGIVIARTEWLYGCRSLHVRATELRDGKPIEPQSFDEPQCELVATRSISREIPSAVDVMVERKTGGLRPEPERGR